MQRQVSHNEKAARAEITAGAKPAKRGNETAVTESEETREKRRHYMVNFGIDDATIEAHPKLLVPSLTGCIIPRLEYFVDRGASTAEVRDHAATIVAFETDLEFVRFVRNFKFEEPMGVRFSTEHKQLTNYTIVRNGYQRRLSKQLGLRG